MRKKQVAPYVPEHIREWVHEIATHLHQPDGDTGARIIMAALSDVDAITRLAPYLLRGYARGNRAWLGHRDHDDLRHWVSPCGSVLERLHMRFTHDDWASLDALGFALGSGTAPAAAALLRLAYANPRIMQTIAPEWVPTSPVALREGS